MLDQALSSGTNFALGAFVAATVDARDFGAFSIVYAVYGVALALSAGFVSAPLIVRFSASEGQVLRRAQLASVGSAIVCGVVFGALAVVVCVTVAGSLHSSLLALGITLPGLLLQDAWRYAFLAEGRPKRAAANDALWAVLQVLGTVGLAVFSTISTTSMVLVWGGSATIAALVGAAQAWECPRPQDARWWLLRNRDLNVRYALEYCAHRSGLWVSIAVVGSLAGLDAVAALRGGLLLVCGPLILLYAGTGFVSVPEGVRLLASSPRAFLRGTRIFSVVLTAIAAVWCGVLLALSSLLGPRLLGDTWPLARPLLGILVIFAVLQAVSVAPGQGLWAMGAASSSLRTQVAGVALLFGCVAGGTELDGARGAAWGAVLTTAVTTVAWWWQFRRNFAWRQAAPSPMLAVEA